jgi:hypothetical protein
MLDRAAVFAALLMLAACGGADGEATPADGNDVGAKAVADVDAAMAETLRAKAPPAAAAPAGAGTIEN